MLGGLSALAVMRAALNPLRKLRVIYTNADGYTRLCPVWIAAALFLLFIAVRRFT